MILRNYQRGAVDGVAREWNDVCSTLVVLPCGCGKTCVSSFIIKRMFPRKAMFIVHREELATQAQRTIERVTGYHVEVEMGERVADLSGRLSGMRPQVVVASVQTLTAGGDGGGRMGRFDPNDFGLLICDEAHHSVSDSWRRVVAWFQRNPDLKMLGVTATPDRADEEALGQVYETVAFDYEILDAINDGWLVPIEQQMVTVGDLDFSKIRTTCGDLNGGDLAQVMEAEGPLHGIASASIDIIGGKRALVFAASVKHASMLCEIFNRHKAGCAAFVCGETDKEVRREILRRYESGEIQILVNCAVFTEGFDSPATEVIIMGKPTKSRALYAQCVGRALRPLPGVVDHAEADTPEARRARIAASTKPTALIVDFEGNAGRHKLMSSADILGGKVRDVVLDRAREMARHEKTNMVDAIERAKRDVEREEEEERTRQAAKRAKLIAKAQYSVSSISPFDVLGVTPWQPRAWDHGKQLSDKQQALLARQGIDPLSISYAEGRQLVTEIVGRFDKGLCSFKQARLLAKYGLNTNVSREEASKQIAQIAMRKWRRATNQEQQ